ncbi:Multi Antimicrobial Extrusion [Blattamonas nauphoetae]|uniref:Multi Antimicrobial Extrusion n=1 Tax=Blattamonas nauphoetae TaxID=2049346 RepID=A0ABQ9Y451_9EUKA|nr:Multi Antimicrobial Extrusion [Blattamonas nauphoetae]
MNDPSKLLALQRERGRFTFLMDEEDEERNSQEQQHPISLRSAQRTIKSRDFEDDQTSTNQSSDPTLEDQIGILINKTQSTNESEQLASVLQLRNIMQNAPIDRTPIFVRHNVFDYLTRFLQQTSPPDAAADVLSILTNLSYASKNYAHTILSPDIISSILLWALSDHQRASSNAWACLNNVVADCHSNREFLVRNDIFEIIFNAIQKSTMHPGEGDISPPDLTIKPPLCADTFLTLRLLLDHQTVQLSPQNVSILIKFLYSDNPQVILTVLECIHHYLKDLPSETPTFEQEKFEQLNVLYPPIRGDETVPFCSLVWQLFQQAFTSMVDTYLTFNVFVGLSFRRRVEMRRRQVKAHFLTKFEQKDLDNTRSLFNTLRVLTATCLKVIGLIAGGRSEFTKLVTDINIIPMLGELLVMVDGLENEDPTSKIVQLVQDLREGLANESLPPRWTKLSNSSVIALQSGEPTPSELSFDTEYLKLRPKRLEELSLKKDLSIAIRDIRINTIFILSNLASDTNTLSYAILTDLFPHSESPPQFTAAYLIQMFEIRSHALSLELVYLMKNLTLSSPEIAEYLIKADLFTKIVNLVKSSRSSTGTKSTATCLELIESILSCSPKMVSTTDSENLALRSYYESNVDGLIIELAKSKSTELRKKTTASSFMSGVQYQSKPNRNCLSRFLRWHSPAGMKEVIKIGAPMLLSEGSNFINQFVDRLFQARYQPVGYEKGIDVAVVSVGWSTVSVITYLILGISVYFSIALSAEVDNDVNPLVGQLFWNTLYVSVAYAGLAACAIPALKPLFTAMSSDEPSMDYLIQRETQYGTFVLSFSIVFILYDIGASFFAALGKPIPVLVVNIICICCNVLFNFIFVVVANQGAMGSAYSVIITKALGSIIFFFLLFVNKKYRKNFHFFKCKSFKPNCRFILKSFLQGLAIGFVDCLDSIVWTLYFLIAQFCGENEVTALGYAGSIYDIFTLIANGSGGGMKIIASSYNSDGRPDLTLRAVRMYLYIVIPYFIVVVILFAGFPSTLVKMFVPTQTPENQPIFDVANLSLRLMLIYLCFDFAQNITTSILQSANRTAFPPLTTLLGLVIGFGIPCLMFALIGAMKDVTILVVNIMLILFGVFRFSPQLIPVVCGNWRKDVIEKYEKAQLEEEEDSESSENESDLTSEDSVPWYGGMDNNNPLLRKNRSIRSLNSPHSRSSSLSKRRVGPNRGSARSLNNVNYVNQQKRAQIRKQKSRKMDHNAGGSDSPTLSFYSLDLPPIIDISSDSDTKPKQTNFTQSLRSFRPGEQANIKRTKIPQQSTDHPAGSQSSSFLPSISSQSDPHSDDGALPPPIDEVYDPNVVGQISIPKAPVHLKRDKRSKVTKKNEHPTAFEHEGQRNENNSHGLASISSHSVNSTSSLHKPSIPDLNGPAAYQHPLARHRNQPLRQMHSSSKQLSRPSHYRSRDRDRYERDSRLSMKTLDELAKPNRFQQHLGINLIGTSNTVARLLTAKRNDQQSLKSATDIVNEAEGLWRSDTESNKLKVEPKKDTRPKTLREIRMEKEELRQQKLREQAAAQVAAQADAPAQSPQASPIPISLSSPLPRLSPSPSYLNRQNAHLGPPVPFRKKKRGMKGELDEETRSAILRVMEQGEREADDLSDSPLDEPFNAIQPSNFNHTTNQSPERAMSLVVTRPTAQHLQEAYASMATFPNVNSYPDFSNDATNGGQHLQAPPSSDLATSMQSPALPPDTSDFYAHAETISLSPREGQTGQIQDNQGSGQDDVGGDELGVPDDDRHIVSFLPVESIEMLYLATSDSPPLITFDDIEEEDEAKNGG